MHDKSKSELENIVQSQRREISQLSTENEILRRNIRDLEEQLHLEWNKKGE